MKRGKKFLYIIGSIIAVLVLAIVVLVLSRSTFIQAAPEELFECNTYQFSDPGAINLVFIASQQETQEYADYLLSSQPFDEYQDHFNVYYINQYIPTCEIYRGVAFLCYSREITRVASSCPVDYTIVLKNGPPQIRSSAYRNVVSINTASDLSVLLHEMGHAIANLAEEYIPANIPFGSENCQSSCEDFEGEIDGCSLECSRSDYYRSIESGVMRTLSVEEFGVFNDNLIRAEIEDQADLVGESSITGNAINEITDCVETSQIITEYNQITGEKRKTRSVGCVPKRAVIEGKSPYAYTDAKSEEKYPDGTHKIDGETFIPDLPIIIQVEETKVQQEKPEEIIEETQLPQEQTPEQQEQTEIVRVEITTVKEGTETKETIEINPDEAEDEESIVKQVDQSKVTFTKEAKPSLAKDLARTVVESTFGKTEETTKIATEDITKESFIETLTKTKEEPSQSPDIETKEETKVETKEETITKESFDTKEETSDSKITAQVIAELQTNSGILGMLIIASMITVFFVLVFMFKKRPSENLYNSNSKKRKR